MTERAGGPIVVGVDGSEASLEAARWGAADAASTGAALRLVFALAVPSPHHVGGIDLGPGYRDNLAEAARAVLDTAAAGAADRHRGLLVETELRTGFAVPILLEESRHARRLVVGSRGLGGVAGLLLGSAAVALVSHAACPVVVVRGSSAGGPGDDRPVVVGIDGSALSEAATELAFEQAAAREVPLIAVHAWSDHVPVGLGTSVDLDSVDADQRRLLAERLAGWREKYRDVEVRTSVVRDRPAHALVEQSGVAQLLVVGSRGRGQAAGLLLGSVSHAALHKAPCPVLVVRPAQGAELGG